MKPFDSIKVLLILLAAIYAREGLIGDDRNRQVARYEDFGARGDGKTDDIQAIATAHAYANRHGLPVKADDKATYYIGGQNNTVVIQTDTDFGTAQFIIDDTNVENRKAHVFEVRSKLEPFKPQGISSLKRNQPRITVELPTSCVIQVTDSTTKRYIRRGLNQNNGSSQTDVFIAEKSGSIDANTPIVWDFDRITDIVAYPIDATPLTINGGRFTTIANSEESKYNYFARGISIRRSNVELNGLEHRIIGEGTQGAPYSAFIDIEDCANVTVRNATLSGHKTYRTIGNAGQPVSMGSYDIVVARALNVSFINCNQFNDIMDRALWGIMASNYSKNLTYERCALSRFDAHMGVAGATIRYSTLGHVGINAIGTGKLLVENTTVMGRNFINLRRDYGSTWRGEFIIRDCAFVPAGGEPIAANLIGGSNDGQHDFGYSCYMPERITIDGLHIKDSQHPKNYMGPTLFDDFNPDFTSPNYKEKYPYIKTREVVIRGLTIDSGKDLQVSKNPIMFKDVVIKKVD